MTAFDATPALLNTAATDCDNTATQVAQNLAALKTYVQGLNGPWLGPASASFQLLMTEYDRHSNSLHEALTMIGQGLRKNAQEYVSGETTNASNITTIAGSFPAANF